MSCLPVQAGFKCKQTYFSVFFEGQSNPMSLNLGNSFIPRHSPLITSRLLTRLPVDELINLCLLWLTIPSTRPSPTTKYLQSIGFTSREEFIDDWESWLKKFKALNSRNKRKIIDKILAESYRDGLNLLQLAQLDSQLLVSRSNSFQWDICTLSTPSGSSLLASIPDPQQFLKSILDTLATIYLTHIYISRHPHYPLIIIRIQLFDMINTTGATSMKESIISRKPVFIGLPMNSNKLLITPGNPTQDTAYSLILQALERGLSQAMSQEIRITSMGDEVVRSLDSAFILAGNSRFTGSLGAWAVYASGDVDISPFDDAKLHDTFKGMEKCDASEVKKRISMLRFKGGVEKKVLKCYEGGRKRRRRENIEEVERESGDEEEEEVDDETNEYASLVPVQNIEFEVKSEYRGIKPAVKIKFQGNDVFGGLHEMCDRDLADAELIPGWLTGESVRSGRVEDGVFIEKEAKPPRGGSLI